ncbi:MAG: hypothetical protein HY721_14050 [Planctomycetes bacterium]|nr:hypothetical protein [Planctomycetota bacterium]
MTSLLRSAFLENPLVGRQLATQLTGPRLGAVLTFVTGSLLAAGAVTFATALLSGYAVVQEGTAGSLLHSVNGCVIYGLLALLLPIRLSGAIDGPRFDRAFDQLVVTGLSPLRLQLGNWALGLAYALAILLATLPFQVYAYMLGGVPVAQLARGYVLLALYSNVIIAVTLGLSVLEREWLAVLLSIGIFALAAAISVAALLPSVFGWATPLRAFAPVSLVDDIARGMPPGVLGDPVLFLTPIPQSLYPFLLWALLMAPPVVWILLGPSHRFLPGLNNFGAVVLPGDRRRRFFRKIRFALVRKVEIAFFYENRPRWLDGWDFPLRACLGLGAVAFLWAAIVGLCFEGAPRVPDDFKFHEDARFGLAIGLTAGVLFFGLLGLGDPRPRLGWRERVGPIEAPRGLLQSACALLLIAAFVAMHACVLREAVAAVPAPALPSAAGYTLESYTRSCWRFVGSLALFLANLHLAGKVCSRIAVSVATWRVCVVLTAAAVLCLPLLVGVGLAERWLPPGVASIVFASPVVLYLIEDPSFVDDIAPGLGPDEGFRAHLSWQLGFMAALAGLLVLIALLSWARRRRRAGRGAAPAAAAALLVLAALAAACPALRAAPEDEPRLPLEVRLTRGFDGHLFEGEVDFFTLVLKNTGPRAIQGTLRIDLGRAVMRPRSFEAPPGTTAVLRWSEAAGSYYLGSGELLLEAPEGRLRVDVPAPSVTARGSSGAQGEALLLVAEEGAGSPVEPGGRHVRSRPSSLPEDVRAYAGAAAVLVGPCDLSRWTAGQRRALYDFARLGGTVVFHGPLDRAALKGAGEWEGALAARGASSIERGGAVYSVEDLEEGRVLAWLDARGPLPAVPLLTARPLGLGWVGHTSCPEAKAGAVSSDAGAARKALAAAVPASAFPQELPPSRALELELRDSTSLLSVLGFFALYVLLIGPGLFAAFRSKERRRLLPLAAAGLPLAFVLLLPLLHAALHLRPSYAALTRVVYFGAGARRGVACAWLDLQSSGRQGHRLEVRGESLSAYSVRSPSYRGTWDDTPYFRPLDVRRGQEGSAAFDLTLNPWGRMRALVLADAVRETAVTGKALHDRKSKRLSVQVAGLSLPDGPVEGRLIARLESDAGYRVSDFAARVRRGTFTVEVDSEAASSKKRSIRFTGGGQVWKDGWPDPPLPEGPAVWLALFAGDAAPAVSVSSPDLAFEREVGDAGGEAPGPPGATPASGISERGGRLFRSFERAVILQEVPLEVR